MKSPPKCDYVNYDGVKYEEDKATFRKHPNAKSRSNFSISSKARKRYEAIDWSIKTESK